MDFGKLAKDQNNFLVVGKKGSGKSGLGYMFMEAQNTLGKRKAYFYNHPNQELLLKLPFKVENITRLDQLFNLTDAVVLIDEAERYFDTMNKKINEDLKDILSLSRQNNISLIFVAHNSYFINRGIFSYIDVKIIKEVNEGHWELERKHMAVMYRKKAKVFGRENYFLDCPEFQGMYTFEKPDWYTDELSNAFRNKNAVDGIDLFKKMREENASKVPANATECDLKTNETGDERRVGTDIQED